MPYVLFHTYCDDVGPILYALCPIPYPLRKYPSSLNNIQIVYFCHFTALREVKEDLIMIDQNAEVYDDNEDEKNTATPVDLINEYDIDSTLSSDNNSNEGKCSNRLT